MQFKEWLQINEQIHRRLERPATIIIQVDEFHRESISFNEIDFRFENYMPYSVYGMYYVTPRPENTSPAAEQLRKIPGFQAKFPFENRYLIYHKENPNWIEVDFNQNYPELPRNWYQYAEFALNGKVVYFAGNPVAVS